MSWAKRRAISKPTLSVNSKILPTFFPPALGPRTRTAAQHFLFCYYDSIELRPLDDLHTSIDRRLCCLFDCTQPSKTRHCLLFQAKPRCFRVSHPPVQPTLPAWPVHVPQLNEFCFATCLLPIRISKQFNRISNTPRHLHRQSQTLRSPGRLQLRSRVFMQIARASTLTLPNVHQHCSRILSRPSYCSFLSFED